MKKNDNIPLNPNEIIKKYFLDQKFCMAYEKSDCAGKIVQAHAISKKYLKNLAVDNHVIVPIGSSYNKDNLYLFKEIGISRATTFTGFCSKHDHRLFHSFEHSDFISSGQQIYDHAFRALCREFFQKKCLFNFFNEIKNGRLKSQDRTGFSKSELFHIQFEHLRDQIDDHDYLYQNLVYSPPK